ncbi:hypothetical protein GIB67_035274 [Kingdonia uniflora]|uniref:Uncharacterized protein n=1 Tax=Kingdonia uniflora TaxID=39325 RepID=A0A7J7KXX6_9MAGN|nr:hypothetical protein GIB67_035274 [Kingdonia uniflora]
MEGENGIPDQVTIVINNEKLRRGPFEKIEDDIEGLEGNVVPSITVFGFVGKLVGRYYNYQGEPTKYLKGVEAKAARGAQLLEKQKTEDTKFSSCNSRWSQEEGGEVWCDNGYPRLVQRPLEIALTGKMTRRCACFTEEELNQSGLEVYNGCDHLAKVCPV